jgi:accessory gene regulator protein AgrB
MYFVCRCQSSLRLTFGLAFDEQRDVNQNPNIFSLFFFFLSSLFSLSLLFLVCFLFSSLFSSLLFFFLFFFSFFSLLNSEVFTKHPRSSLFRLFFTLFFFFFSYFSYFSCFSFYFSYSPSLLLLLSLSVFFFFFLTRQRISTMAKKKKKKKKREHQFTQILTINLPVLVGNDHSSVGQHRSMPNIL